MAPYLPKIQDYSICQLTARSAYVPPPADYATNVTLDWATDTDELIGPVPSASDFCPTKPLSPLLSPNPASCSPDNSVKLSKLVRILSAPTDCNSTAPMSFRDVFVFAKPDRTSTKTTAASITGEMAPSANAAHFPISLSKSGTDRHPKGSGEPPSPLASLQPAPSPRACNLRSNQQGHVTASKHRALPEPTVSPPNSDVTTETLPVEPAVLPLIEPDSAPAAPILLDNRITTAHVDAFADTPTVYTIPAHPPRDLSGLKSGAQNPWGSLNHCNCRVHPLQMHNPHSGSEPLKIFHSRTWRSKPIQPFVGKSQHSQLHSHPLSAPVIQTIQHPRGISPIKPKITKTVSIASRLPLEIHKPIPAAQCMCGRNIIPVYPPCRSQRFAGTRRRFGRRFGTWRESWDCGRGRSHFLGGIQAWGPRFVRGGVHGPAMLVRIRIRR